MEENHLKKKLLIESKERRTKKGKETTNKALEEERRGQSPLLGNGEWGRYEKSLERMEGSNKQHKHAILNKFF